MPWLPAIFRYALAAILSALTLPLLTSVAIIDIFLAQLNMVIKYAYLWHNFVAFETYFKFIRFNIFSCIILKFQFICFIVCKL